MEITIRPLGPDDDRASVGALVLRGYFALDGYPHDDEYDAMVADVGARESWATVVVAVLEGRIAGCLTYIADVDAPHVEHDDAEAATFRFFAVDPDVQGRGVGTALVDWVIERARRDGKARIRIHTLEVMRGACSLYLRAGFVRDPLFDEDYDGVAGVAYRLDL